MRPSYLYNEDSFSGKAAIRPPGYHAKFDNAITSVTNNIHLAR